MEINFSKSLKNITCLSMLVMVAACGGGGDFEPVYDETQMPNPDRRINGEMPFSSPSLMKMAESFRAANDYPNAIRFYQRAANESPRHVTSRLALAEIYQQLGAHDGAALYYQQVLELEPDHVDAKLGLGQVMVLGNRPMEAVGYLEEVATTSPDNFRIYNSIGVAYDLQGLHEQAQNAYSRGLNIQPDHISLINNLALSLAIEGEYAPAIQLLSKAVNLDYSQTTAQQNLIMVYGMSGDERSARTMASSFMTPEEIEEKILHYRWLKSLTSERRAQAIFLNLTSFPEERAPVVVPEGVVQVASPTVTEETISEETDPKKRMLMDILNAEEGARELEAPPAQVIGAKETEEFEGLILPQSAIDSEEMIPNAAMETGDANVYKLQLGAYSAVDQLVLDWERLKGVAPELLADASIDVEDVDLGGGRKSYRLYIDEYDNFSAADGRCSALKGKNVPCVVVNKEK
ncbi:tetratricopeptide repeat protein [Pseudemcibacter aquimaris]|uniref:SPOR domain-containing protein n=1 Tax=Pseudemcibacter aquimaris TaxID=2857064 RepID=UPI0020130E17|nr:SPOR domain-containing protein [Pseudemcibacter aquimaris]MCC3861109.1 tetratricopeptide repeat protein [Pseudemcibacter aquimaris]WDU59927.1 tetratricopeptide repeat protein [Pseudemcibacter aquimaris]